MSQLAQFIRSIKGQNYLILDTETTGLNDGEIVQIAIIDHEGIVLVDTLIKPKLPIPADATAIHGITNDMVKESPTWPEISPKIEAILTGQNVLIYNAVYDRKMMHKSAERHSMPKTEWKEIAKFFCVMEAYAEFYGDWNDYRGSYKWQRLSTAAASARHIPNAAHSALGDCITTWHVVKMLLEMNPEDYEDLGRSGGDENEY